MEIRRLTARLRALRRFGLDLCLGHMVSGEHPEPVYVGRLGLTDSQGRRLLIDWRSPAAEPFFGATHANPMGLASRRRYRWTRGRVSDYWDEVFTPDGFEGHAALEDLSAFIASLGSSRSAQMRDVLGTIQADQDAIIRASSRGALVVDGGPGTGKTVVALHRSAYLLYSDPRLGHRGAHSKSSVLFIGPHRPYLAYVADLLPTLGEEGVQTCTLRDLVPEGATAAIESDPGVALLKSSADMVKAIEPAVRFYEEPPTKGMEVETPYADLWLSLDDWAEAFEAPEPGTAHNEARDAIWEELLTILVDKYDGDDVPDGLLRRALAQNADSVHAFNRAWPLLKHADLSATSGRCRPICACAPLGSALTRSRAQRREPTGLDRVRLAAPGPARQRSATPRRHGTSSAARRRSRRARAHGPGGSRLGRGRSLRTAGDVDSAGDLQEKPGDQGAAPAPTRTSSPARPPTSRGRGEELTERAADAALRSVPELTVVGDRAQARHGFAESWLDGWSGSD